ncbi:MAG TPA: 3'-5' exonuclease, partial [Pseudomonadota bacterium]|nr:3'-5' exonuclease [Pseudomonadota bacterium]
GAELSVALERLLEAIGPRPLLGWCLPFDRAILDRELRPRFGLCLPNPGIDLRDAWERHARRRWPDREPALALDAIAAALGVPVLDRHDAYGDALTTALCWIALESLPR